MNWVPGSLCLIGKQIILPSQDFPDSPTTRKLWWDSQVLVSTPRLRLSEQKKKKKKEPHSYTIQLVMVNVKLTRWTLCFSFFFFPLPLLQRPDGIGLYRRSGHLRKIPLLEHVDTWEMFLFEENRGRNRSLKSVAHCVFRQFGGMKT